MNILLDGPQKNIKLADFGICTIMEVRSCPLYVIYIILFTYGFALKKGSTYTEFIYLSLTRGFNQSNLTGKILLFLIGGRLWEIYIVAHGGSTVLVFIASLSHL